MIYEIRDYTIEKEWFEQYVVWVKEFFLPYAQNKINIIDFWAYDGVEAEVEGKNPVVSPNGQPNITWVAKYNNKQERDDFFASLETDPDWEKVWSNHPNPDAYIHENARFFRSIDHD